MCELPAILGTALPAALRTLAVEELAGKQYDKTRTHKTEKYVDLPAPTLSDPKRKKRHKVISVTEESRVAASWTARPTSAFRTCRTWPATPTAGRA